LRLEILVTTSAAIEEGEPIVTKLCDRGCPELFPVAWGIDLAAARRRAADAGDVEAQFQLAQLARLSPEVSEDSSSEALLWYRKAAESGHLPESTIPFMPASPAPDGLGGGAGGDDGETADVMLDAPPGVPVPAETMLDHPTPAPLGRGRTRERERERDRAGHTFPLRQNNPVEGDLVAAAAAVAALHAATEPEVAVSVDALRTHEHSPEKKAKVSSGTKMPPPAFGGTGGGRLKGKWRGKRFRAPSPFVSWEWIVSDSQAAAASHPPPAGLGPQVFHLDGEPPWLDAIRGDLREIVDTQRQLAKGLPRFLRLKERLVGKPSYFAGIDVHDSRSASPLSELGDVKGLAEGAHRDDLFDIAGELYVGYVRRQRSTLCGKWAIDATSFLQELDNQSDWDQVVDGILAAQSTMALIRATTGSPAKVAKLDIKAAFDSISHHAVYRWLMACQPGWEAERIMHLCFDTRVLVSIGGESKELPMQQGIMQGSAFSADIFSRVVDWYLGGLLPRMDELEPRWDESVSCLPHFLIYADDITVFATTEAALQAKVRLLVATLEVIGLHVNPDKRFWLYHGHLARSVIDHPMTRILRVCSSTNLRRGLRPRWIADLSVRKLQKVFSRLEHAEQYVCWEEAAQDRDTWIGLLDSWWRYWLPASKEPVLSLDYLLQRQIVLVRGPKEAHSMFLRPPRDVLEEPYASPLLDIREYTGKRKGVIWMLLYPHSCCAVLQPYGVSLADPCCVHVHVGDADPLPAAVSCLLLGLKTVFLLRSFGYECEALVAPIAKYHRGIFQENLPLSLLSDYSSLRTLLDREDCPALCFSPKKLKGAQSDLLSRFSVDPPKAMDPDTDALLCHGKEDVVQLCLDVVLPLLPQIPGGVLTFGLCSRVRFGLHLSTRRFSRLVDLCTLALRQHFPGEPFLACKIQYNPHLPPHRDCQNSHLPNLAIELLPAADGGTWIENPDGSVAMECPDGCVRWGSVLTGSYRFSARRLLHSSYPGCGTRVLLVAWVPSSWDRCPVPLMQEVLDLGFVAPTHSQAQRAKAIDLEDPEDDILIMSLSESM
ncbi:unnamed protein product, partial [Symbiodinium microadriaticum]